MNLFLALMLVASVITQAHAADRTEVNPDAPPDPLNKIFFGVREHSAIRPPRSIQTEVPTVNECLGQAAAALNRPVDDDVNEIEVRCIKERNAEKPS